MDPKEAVIIAAGITASPLLQSALEAAIREEKSLHEKKWRDKNMDNGESWVDPESLKKADIDDLLLAGKKKSKHVSKLERQRELGMI